MNKEKNYIEKLEAMEKALDNTFKGLITEVTETTNTEFYKSEEKKTEGLYDEKDGLDLTIVLKTSPTGEEVEFHQFFGIPKTLGLKQSNIALFKNKYKTFPKKGMEVDVIVTEEGFFRVVL